MAQSKPIKCYLSQTDDVFDPSRDIVLGSWCFKDMAEMRKCRVNIPFIPEEELIMHRKLYDLSFYLLNRDVEKKGWNTIANIVMQPQYLYFVYFSFSVFRLLKKIKNQRLGIEFERILHDTKEFSYESYFTPDGLALIAQDMIKALWSSSELKFFNKKKSCSFQVIQKKILINHDNMLNKIKKIFNFFYELTGIKTQFGFLLSVLYFFSNILNLRLGVNSIQKYNPEIKLDCETEEYIKIFDKISDKYLRFFNFERKKQGRLLIKHPSFIYNPESFYSVIASVLDGKSFLRIYQHGSAYGTLKAHRPREIEYNISKFITYGSAYESYQKRDQVIYTLPSPYLSSIRNKYIFTNQKRIMWITGFHSKCGDGLEYPDAKYLIQYQDNKTSVFRNLTDSNKDNIYYKPIDFDNSYDDEFANNFDDKKTLKGEIIKHILNSKIFFVDYYSTAIYEAMSLNAPFICAFFERKHEFTDDFKNMLNQFKNVGIFCESPDDVAHFINNLSAVDIKQWWLGEEVQTVRREFLKKYANNNPYFLPWVKAILKREI